MAKRLTLASLHDELEALRQRLGSAERAGRAIATDSQARDEALSQRISAIEAAPKQPQVTRLAGLFIIPRPTLECWSAHARRVGLASVANDIDSFLRN